MYFLLFHEAWKSTLVILRLCGGHSAMLRNYWWGGPDSNRQFLGASASDNVHVENEDVHFFTLMSVTFSVSISLAATPGTVLPASQRDFKAVAPGRFCRQSQLFVLAIQA